MLIISCFSLFTCQSAKTSFQVSEIYTVVYFSSKSCAVGCQMCWRVTRLSQVLPQS